MFYFFPFIFMFLIIVSLALFYLDDFKLSKSSFIKYLQILCFICILIYPIICYYFLDDFFNIILYLDDNSKDSVNLHGHVNLDKDAAKVINKGLSTIGSQIGLGASIAGMSTAVAKGIAKSSMPPLQKASIIVASGLITGFGHSVISNINRNNIMKDDLSYASSNASTNISSSNNINSDINKFINNNNESISPLENLIFDIEALNYICLSLVIILIIQITFKFFFPKNVTLNLSKLFGININNSLEYYLNKIIKLNKDMSNIYMWLILILLLIGLSLSGYASSELCNNIDSYVDVYNSLKNN